MARAVIDIAQVQYGANSVKRGKEHYHQRPIREVAQVRAHEAQRPQVVPGLLYVIFNAFH